MESPAERKSIVCGDLRGQATTVRMGPPDETGDNVSGTATLNLDRASKRLTVKLVLDGLEPNTSHPAHLYAGSCESQGPVAKPLNTVRADASGHGEEETVLTNVTSIGGWYVNVHRGPGIDSPQEFTPISCGDVARGWRRSPTGSPSKGDEPVAMATCGRSRCGRC
jgi:hypothetical protein